MAFFKRKDKKENSSGKNTEAKAGNDEKALERQRAKKISAMKKKFDETVWNSVMDVMKSDMPDFVIMKSKKGGDEYAVYVLLGFDTRIVDDFSNKSDDDIGSIMTAIKSSMDVVVENGLFENELILMIPTERTFKALSEFEDTFDLKFCIAYVTEDHTIDLETRPGSEDLIYVTLPDIRAKQEDDVPVKDWIKDMRSRSGSDFGEEGLTDDEDEDQDEDGDQSKTSGIEDDDEIYDDEPYEEDGPPDDDFFDDEVPVDDDYEPEPDAKLDKKSRLVSVASEAVKNAEKVSDNIEEQRESIVGAGSDEDEAPEDEPAAQTSVGQPASPTSVKDKINKLKGAVQQASDEAAQDPDVAAAANILMPTVSTFDVHEMDTYITRKYYSDDLDMEISSQPFDAMFLQNNTYVPFAEDLDEGWLTAHANSLRRDANARLAKLHQENILMMRERFMLIINKHAEEVVKAVSTDDPKSRFGYALRVIKQIKDDQVAGLSQTAEAYKREKEANFQERLKQEMANASNMARTNFLNRYGKEHERELKDIETDLRNNIESEYVAAYDNLQKERRNEAKRQLDVGITEALQLCADEYTKMLAKERQEYIRLQEIITQFTNDNMAAEHARIMTLAEKQRRENEVADTRSEYSAKLDSAQKDFEARLAAVRAQIDQNNLEHENYLETLRAEHQKDLQQLRDRHQEQMELKSKEVDTLAEQLATANDQLEMITQKYTELDAAVGQKYASQIDMLRSERDAWSERAEQVKNLHRYTDRLKISVVCVSVAAALGIGILIGVKIMSGQAANQQQYPIINYYEVDDEYSLNGGEAR